VYQFEVRPIAEHFIQGLADLVRGRAPADPLAATGTPRTCRQVGFFAIGQVSLRDGPLRHRGKPLLLGRLLRFVEERAMSASSRR